MNNYHYQAVNDSLQIILLLLILHRQQSFERDKTEHKFQY
ncbi:MAG: hypothetical protein OFPI_05790 [Osedax symbiont Rs2]|nr:MAG: hypothetical protein OFPI_05790 [Osedax symbiont Rs2]